MIKRISEIAAAGIAFLLVVGASAYLTVTLIIGSEDTVVVPELNGKDVVYVLKALTDLGLNTKVKGLEYDDAVPENHVIYQEPEAGSEIKRGRDIRIILSRGSLTVLTPKLIGLPLQQAGIILDENGLCPGQMSSTYSDLARKEEVIAQVPPAGVTIRRSECVDLLTSMGTRPAAYNMPALIGKPLEESVLLIEGSNLRLGEIRPVGSGMGTLNAIVSQDPAAGERVVEGGTVSLEVNTKDYKTEGAVIENAGGGRLYRYRPKSGFLKEQIRIQVNWFGFSGDIYDGFVRPGEEVWVLIPKNLDVSLSLFKNDELAENLFFPAWRSKAN